MKREYMDIVARLVNAMKQDAPTWVKPWETEKSAYPNAVKPIDSADAVLNAYYNHEKIRVIEREQKQSYYAPDADAIYLPLKKQFISTDSYYAVKAHETIHSTGDYTRCDRAIFSEYTSFGFGDSRYSQEELVAELGACFLLLELGIDTTRAEQNANAYIHNWLTHLNHNTNWIYRSSELASEAVDYVLESADRYKH